MKHLSKRGTNLFINNPKILEHFHNCFFCDKAFYKLKTASQTTLIFDLRCPEGLAYTSWHRSPVFAWGWGERLKIKNTIKIGFSEVKFSRSLLYIYQQLFLDNMLHYWALGALYGWIGSLDRARCLIVEHC